MPLEPMLAKGADDLPTGDGWSFEPKWDGFRCIVFRDGDEIELASRASGRSRATSPSCWTRCASSSPPAASSTASWW